jgi:hypothetical protein
MSSATEPSHQAAEGADGGGDEESAQAHEYG